MQPVEIDGGQNVCDVRRGNVEFGQELYFAARNGRVNVQLTCDCDEILLQNLEGDDAGAGAAVLLR